MRLFVLVVGSLVVIIVMMICLLIFDVLARNIATMQPLRPAYVLGCLGLLAAIALLSLHYARTVITRGEA